MSPHASELPAEIVSAIERGVVNRGGGADWLIAVLAGVQHGVVARAQLLQLGVTPAEVAVRLRNGRLHRIHRGVYLVGHRAAPPLAREMAAVLACGPRAVVSHRSAAVLWSLLRGPKPDPVEVTVAAEWSSRRPDIRVHRTNSLKPQDIRRQSRIRVTSPARTVLDLAADLPYVALERMVAEGHVRQLIRRSELRSQLDRNRGRPGIAPLKTLLEQDGRLGLTRSGAEERLLGLVRAARLSTPETNVRLGEYEVDFSGGRRGSSSRSTGSPITRAEPPSSGTGDAMRTSPPEASP